MEPSLDTQDLVIPEGIRQTVSEDGAVLLDIEQGICFSLNPVGLKIWELLRKRLSLDQIADELARDFPVPRVQLVNDTQEFIRSLEERRLIHRTRPNTRPPQSWARRLLSLGRAG